MKDGRKKISYEKYCSLLGRVPEGKELVVTSLGNYYIKDKVCEPLYLKKRKKK